MEWRRQNLPNLATVRIDLPREENQFPIPAGNMPEFQDIRNCATLAIEAMESLYCSACRQDSIRQSSRFWMTAGAGCRLPATRHLKNESVVRNQARIIWKQTIYRKMPAVWFVRLLTAENAVLTAICQLAGISLEKIVNGALDEKDFARLTCVVGHIAATPLWVCEIRSPGQFEEAIEALADEHTFAYAICDWRLAGDELTFAERIARRSKLTFLCPV